MNIIIHEQSIRIKNGEFLVRLLASVDKGRLIAASGTGETPSMALENALRELTPKANLPRE